MPFVVNLWVQLMYTMCPRKISFQQPFSQTDTLVRLKIDDGQLSKISGILPKIQFSTSDHENISDA